MNEYNLAPASPGSAGSRGAPRSGRTRPPPPPGSPAAGGTSPGPARPPGRGPRAAARTGPSPGRAGCSSAMGTQGGTSALGPCTVVSGGAAHRSISRRLRFGACFEGGRRPRRAVDSRLCPEKKNAPEVTHADESGAVQLEKNVVPHQADIGGAAEHVKGDRRLRAGDGAEEGSEVPPLRGPRISAEEGGGVPKHLIRAENRLRREIPDRESPLHHLVPLGLFGAPGMGDFKGWERARPSRNEAAAHMGAAFAPFRHRLSWRQTETVRGSVRFAYRPSREARYACRGEPFPGDVRQVNLSQRDGSPERMCEQNVPQQKRGARTRGQRAQDASAAPSDKSRVAHQACVRSRNEHAAVGSRLEVTRDRRGIQPGCC